MCLVKAENLSQTFKYFCLPPFDYLEVDSITVQDINCSPLGPLTASHHMSSVHDTKLGMGLARLTNLMSEESHFRAEALRAIAWPSTFSFPSGPSCGTAQLWAAPSAYPTAESCNDHGWQARNKSLCCKPLAPWGCFLL